MMLLNLGVQALIWGLLPIFASAGVPKDPAWPYDATTLKSPDGSITAEFVSVGATLTKLLVKGKDGKARDVVLGYDDQSLLSTDPAHPYFNSIIGRYANRMNNGTFSIPISKNPTPGAPGTYHITTNDRDGQVTLHGGVVGWDRHNWTIVERSKTSVTYKHIDAGDEGFPGTVTAYVTHSVSNGGVLKTKIRATASEKTPIMLTRHDYLNLDGFEDGSDTILDHYLHIDGSRVIELNDIAIPTGKFIDVKGTPFDYKEARTIGTGWDATVNLCGQGCQGIDHAWIYDRDASKRPGTSLWSTKSGIRLDITTDQPSVQIYTSNWMNNPRKKVHGGPDKLYGLWSGIAVEQQSYVAAINTPEWGIDQIYSPKRPYDWVTTYKFSTLK